ncbi:T6SS immunity protein Tli4 family protein [Variovorax ureilyticus]|uniref:T6SS immunity protein Tli4 family protein n=1 Tax=Variovorax ureilyticus TaxID=1836198 RepID=A0ABU8VAL3_9BURK
MTNHPPTGQRRRPYSRWALIALAFLLVLVAAASMRGWLPFIYAPGYTPKTMTTVTTQRTTHCIGRYLITLPSNFELITGGWGDVELYYGLDKNFERVYATVKPGRYTNEEFWKEVNKRRFELDGKTNAATKTSMLLHGEQLNNSSALLRRLGDEHYGLSIKTEVHVLVGPRHVMLEQESYSNDDNNVSHKNADPAPAEARLKMIASKLLPYENAERAKPGFCVQGVLFDVGQDDETALFDFYADDLPDTHLRVSYHAVTGQPSQGLLERVQDSYKAQPLFRTMVATVREGKTQLGGEAAEESLVKTTRPVTQHLFSIERRDNQPRSLDRPFFGIAFDTGNEYDDAKGERHPQDNSSLSDEQVLKLWDEMVASVRKR